MTVVKLAFSVAEDVDAVAVSAYPYIAECVFECGMYCLV